MDFQTFMTFLDGSSTKAPAICMSVDDFNTMKTQYEELCRMLGSRCIVPIDSTPAPSVEE